MVDGGGVLIAEGYLPKALSHETVSDLMSE